MSDQHIAGQGLNRIFGVLPGSVTDLEDKEGMGRVLVRFHTLASEENSYWARIATLYSGNDRGILFRPEVGDEVLCAFEHGDIQYPFVLGGLWNGQQTPPDIDTENNIKMIVTRSGHKITFDDKANSEKIEIQSRSGQKIVLNDSVTGVEKIQIETTPKGTVEIACLNANIKAQGGLNVNTPRAVFSGILEAKMIQTQTIIATLVAGSSYTPAPGNTFGL